MGGCAQESRAPRARASTTGGSLSRGRAAAAAEAAEAAEAAAGRGGDESQGRGEKSLDGGSFAGVAATLPRAAAAHGTGTWSAPATPRRFISEAGARDLLNYRYAGCDNSLMYIYFCSPLAELLVRRFVPPWVAPNLITAVGLVLSLLGHGLVWFYCGHLQAPCPRWCWVIVSSCTFAYQTLDNMDGKQARRTGTSSALGLALDHGADALNIVLSAQNVMAMLRTGGSCVTCLCIWLACATPFFFATWEEFHTGSLYLGAFNGPTDGVLILCAAQLLSGAVEDYGRFWRTPALGGLSRGGVAIAFYGACVLATVFGNIRAVLRLLLGDGPARPGSAGPASPSRGGPRPALRLPAWRALGAAVPFVATQAAVAWWLLGTASGAEAFERSPRLVLWLLGLTFLDLVGQLQVAHICGEAYQPWTWLVFAPPLAFAGNEAAAVAFGASWGRLVDPAFLLNLSVAAHAASYSRRVWGVAREMASILGTPVFSLAPMPGAYGAGGTHARGGEMKAREHVQ